MRARIIKRPEPPKHINGFDEHYHRILRHDTSFGRALQMIKQGIVSKNFAKRAGIEFEQNHPTISLDNHVSVYDSNNLVHIFRPPGSKQTAMGAFELFPAKHDLVSFFIVLPDSRISFQQFFNILTDESEQNVLHRIRPQNFIAIKLNGTVSGSEEQKIIALAKEKNIPLYDYQGNRIWPPMKK